MGLTVSYRLRHRLVRFPLLVWEAALALVLSALLTLSACGGRDDPVSPLAAHAAPPAASTAADLLAEIRTLTRGYVYRGSTYAERIIAFSCRTPQACIASPDGRRQFRGFGIACPDATVCNRLVVDFTSLLDQVAARTPPP